MTTIQIDRALSRIVPPPTVRGQRRITRVRLLKMQEELSTPIDPVTSEVAPWNA